MHGVARLLRSAALRRCLPTAMVGKELRVASRRRRTWVLRFVYVLAFCAIVASAWSACLGGRPVEDSPLARQVLMNAIAEAVVPAVVVFQFFVLQVLAAVVPLRALQDEVNRRTLGVLLTTPLSGFQIVTGKLAYFLLLVVLLLGVAVPVLLLLRVFGGVPLQFVAGGLAITFTATCATAAVSLWVGLWVRGLFGGLAVVVCVFPLVFFVAPFVLLHASAAVGLDRWEAFTRLDYWNPPLALYLLLNEYPNPPPAGQAAYRWDVHCACMCAFATVIVALAAWRVRTAALAELRPRALLGWLRALRRVPGRERCEDPREVRGTPVFWRDRVRLRLYRVLLLVASAAAVLALYAWIDKESWRQPDMHKDVIVVLLASGLSCALYIAAGTVTEEKAAGTWPLVLCTPQSGSRIVADKVRGALHATAPIWFVGVLHTLNGIFNGELAGIALPMLCLLGAGAFCLVAGVSVYSGIRCPTTTGAVLTALIILGAIWASGPAVGGAYDALRNSSRTHASSRLRGSPVAYMTSIAGAAIPLCQAAVVTEDCVRQEMGLPRISQLRRQVGWPPMPFKLWSSIALVACVSFCHVLLGAAFFWRAVKRLRR